MDATETESDRNYHFCVGKKFFCGKVVAIFSWLFIVVMLITRTTRLTR